MGRFTWRRFLTAAGAATAVLADFIVAEMFAEVCTGEQTAKEAVARAQNRAQRHSRT